VPDETFLAPFFEMPQSSHARLSATCFADNGFKQGLYRIGKLSPALMRTSARDSAQSQEQEAEGCFHSLTLERTERRDSVPFRAIPVAATKERGLRSGRADVDSEEPDGTAAIELANWARRLPTQLSRFKRG
jgi:hypothetical protein